MLYCDTNMLGNEMYDMLQRMYGNEEFYDAQPLSNVMNNTIYESLCMHVILNTIIWLRSIEKRL